MLCYSDYIDKAIELFEEFEKLHCKYKEQGLNDEELDRHTSLHRRIILFLLSAWWIDQSGPDVAFDILH